MRNFVRLCLLKAVCGSMSGVKSDPVECAVELKTILIKHMIGKHVREIS